MNAPLSPKGMAALNLAKLGLKVFPAQPDRQDIPKAKQKAPLISDWPNRATTDEKQIFEWWTKWPDANVAILTEGLFVPDVDLRNGGMETFKALRQQGLPFPATLTSRTQGGGFHLIYKLPPGGVVKGGNNKLGPGIDVKTHGGYILAPGSTIEDRPYQWKKGRSPDEIEIAEAPQWMLERCGQGVERKRHKLAGKRLVAEDDWAAEKAEAIAALLPVDQVKGERNRIAFDAACLMFDYAAKEETVVALLDPWRAEVDMFPDDPFSAEQLRATIRSAHDNRQMPIGCKHPNAPGFDPVKIKEREGRPIKKKLIMTSREFVADFKVPAYLVEGIYLNGYLYSLTAKTGHGKTALALLLAECVALGKPFAGREVKKGRVLYFAAENYVDIQSRWIAQAEHHGFDVNEIDVHFVYSDCRLSQVGERIAEEAKAHDDWGLVVIDTTQATFGGDDVNSDVDQVQHARNMRPLTGLRGNPAVLTLSHPIKHANCQADLLPKGGGGFLNEIDGNTTLWRRSDGLCVLHTEGKFRGPTFDPQLFEMQTVTARGLMDHRGRKMPSVLAVQASEEVAAVRELRSEHDEEAVLQALCEQPGSSATDLAKILGWTCGKKNKQPHHLRVTRTLERLPRLVEQVRKKWHLTPKGKKELARIDSELPISLE